MVCHVPTLIEIHSGFLCSYRATELVALIKFVFSFAANKSAAFFADGFSEALCEFMTMKKRID